MFSPTVHIVYLTSQFSGNKLKSVFPIKTLSESIKRNVLIGLIFKLLISMKNISSYKLLNLKWFLQNNHNVFRCTSWIIEVENVLDNRKVDNGSKLMVISDHCELSTGSN